MSESAVSKKSRLAIKAQAQLRTWAITKWRCAIAISLLGLLSGATTLVYALRLRQNQSPPDISTPTVSPRLEAVSALGRLEPYGEVINLAPAPNQGGAKVEKLLVKEGETVKKGQPIAILDNFQRRQATVDVARQAVNVAQSNLAIVQAGAKTGEIQAQQATIEKLEAELAGETATHPEIMARLRAELAGEQQEQTATIERLQAELQDAEREFQRYQKLAQDGVISTSDLEQRQLELEQARERLEEARARRKKTVNTLNESLQEESAKFQKTTNTLNKQIQEAKATLSRIAEIRPVDVEKEQAEVNKAIAELKQAQTDLDLSYIKAPSDGQILKIHSYPGEMVDSENGIVELGKTDQMMVIAEVYESDIGRVKVGQKAMIKSENGTFTNTLQGTVEQIGLQIGKKDVLNTDPAADVDVRVVEVKILLTPESSRRVSGLTYAKVVAEILL